jgi:nanoRNase/pAp phosphatase (c-di-AMP/oligoRNAs hydrolase)
MQANPCKWFLQMVPFLFQIPGWQRAHTKEPKGEHDTFITVDCADFKRTGKVFENFGQPDINIDHHVRPTKNLEN